MEGREGADAAAALRGLRSRADEDFLDPPGAKAAGRHQVDLPELGLRVAMTRSLYPNREDGVDQYAVTVTRTRLDRPPDDADVRVVLREAFGAVADQAIERGGGGPLVRLFRVPGC